MIENSILRQRKDNLDRFVLETFPALEELARVAGIENSSQILTAPWSIVDAVSSFIDNTFSAPHESTWYVTRIGFYIGELIKDKFGGCWYVNESRTSRYFGRYVIGRFSRIKAQGVSVDPFEAAFEYFEGYPPRRFIQLVSEILVAVQDQAAGQP